MKNIKRLSKELVVTLQRVKLVDGFNPTCDQSDTEYPL